MNSNATNDAPAATKILLLASLSEHDGRDYFNSHVADNVDFYIARDGTVFHADRQELGGQINIMIGNVGPVMLHRGKAYPYRLDRNRMPEPDTDRPPVQLFYEFCQFRKFRGFQHYESYTAPQLRTLRELLEVILQSHLIPNNLYLDNPSAKKKYETDAPGIYLNSIVNRRALAPHPQQDLLDLIQNINQ